VAAQRPSEGITVLLVKKSQTMIEIAKGNILEADAEALVNTVKLRRFHGQGHRTSVQAGVSGGTSKPT